MECRVFETFQKNRKIFKIPKRPKIIPKSIQTCFEHVLGRIFRKTFFAQCSVEVRVFENFLKNQKVFKIPKMPKIVPKSIQTCFRVIFLKKFYAQCSMEGRVFENFQRNQKNFQNSKNAQNRSQKYPNVF